MQSLILQLISANGTGSEPANAALCASGGELGGDRLKLWWLSRSLGLVVSSL